MVWDENTTITVPFFGEHQKIKPVANATGL